MLTEVFALVSSPTNALIVLCGCCFLLGWMLSAGVNKAHFNRKLDALLEKYDLDVADVNSGRQPALDSTSV